MKKQTLLFILIILPFILLSLLFSCGRKSGNGGKVTLNIYGLDGEVLLSEEYVSSKNDTAFDVALALCEKNNISIKHSGLTKSMAYISEIDGLAEKQHGSGSGWVYNVNGCRMAQSSGDVYTSEGDVIDFYYSKDMGNDVPGEAPQ